jgi:hypothetical protein
MIWAAAVLTAETLLALSAGFAGFRCRGYRIAEAGAAAIVSVFMVFSLIHQIALICGSVWIGLGLEVGLTVVLACLVYRYRCWLHLKEVFTAIPGLLRRETFSVGILTATWAVMLGLIVIGWLTPGGGLVHSWTDGAAVLPWGGTLPAVTGSPLAPLNSAALFYHCARFGLSPGACGFGLLAHLALGLGTYALARRYAWPPMALTVTLLVVSMPRLVGLGLQPTAELISAAAVTVDLMLLYRLVEQPLPGDLALFLLCTAFSIHAHPMSLGLPPVLMLLLLVVMVRRHGWIIWRELLAGRWLGAALAIALGLILAQVPAFGLNLARGYPLLGAPHGFGSNGLFGAAANLLHYLLLGIDPTEAVRRAVFWLTGLDLAHLVTGIAAVAIAPLAAKAGVKAVFTPVFTGGSSLGFGPCLPLLVMAAIIHALRRGPRRLKAVSVAWGGYLYLAAVVLVWRPDSLAVLTPLYSANGFMVAFLLPPYRLRRRGMRLFQWLSLLLLILSFYLALRGAFPLPGPI